MRTLEIQRRAGQFPIRGRACCVGYRLARLRHHSFWKVVMVKSSIVAVLAAIVLTGCAASPVPEAAESSPSSDLATENQVASVLAEYEPEWRERIAESASCRFTWTLGGATIAEEISADACYIAETTMGITAQLVVRDWNELRIPPSMSSLVEDTSKILTAIGDIDLATICGTEARPADTPECTEALGSRNFFYGLLDSQLDKWSPYL